MKRRILVQAKKSAHKKDSWRDLTLTKKCKICRKTYHPKKKNNYYVSKYCSVMCSRKGSANNFSRRGFL